VRFWLCLLAGVLCTSAAHAQGYQCRTSPVGGSAPPAVTAYCASEAFVSDHFPASSTSGHIATFADGSGQTLQDGGTASGGTVTSVGSGAGLTGGPITSSGTLKTAAGVDNDIVTTQTSNYTAANADCGAPILLGGNAQFTLTVNAANTYTANCHLILINSDAYTGAGSGRGKIMAISGITGHVLYPGQKLDLRANGSSWVTDQILSGSNGQVWFPAFAVQFFMDTGGSDSNDGLASGAGGAFLTKVHCAGMAYNLVYTRNLGSVQCSQTAGQTPTAEFVSVFYPISGGGTLIFNSATPGSQWTWICPAGNYCLQFGDGALVGLTDMELGTNTTSKGVIFGHNHGVLDLNTNILFVTNTGQPLFSCDFDTHFNINNGFTYQNNASFLFSGCQGSRWNINGALTASGTPTLSRYFNFASGSLATFQGNVTFPGAVTTSVGLVTGGSVMNNLSGNIPPGGAPTPTNSTSTGFSAYCTTLC
jgi:hypothetical protein